MATSSEGLPRRSRTRWLVLAGGLLAAGCSPVGTGVGTVEGTISVPECDIPPGPYSLGPRFFAAEPVADFLSIRVQNGSEPIDRADGVMVEVVSASMVQESMLGQPIPLSLDPQAPVRMSFYLLHTCPSTRTMAGPVVSAVSGTITFTAIYAQDISTDERLIEATFDSVHFADADDPDAYADLSGSFRFLFSRGRPLQVYP